MMLTGVIFKYCFDIMWFLGMCSLVPRVRDLPLGLFSCCVAHGPRSHLTDERCNWMSLSTLRASIEKCSKVNC